MFSISLADRAGLALSFCLFNLFNISGKTGTCQVGYSTGDVQYISSFVGYFPADEPIFSSIVVILNLF